MSCCTLKEVLCNGKGAKLRLSSSIMAKSYGRDNPACATNYQDHILWSYAYFQDAASKKDYCNKSLFDPLWDHVHDLQQKLDGAGSSNETSTSVGWHCSWCHRTGLHSDGQANCLGKTVTAAQVWKLLKGVPKIVGAAKIKQACTKLASQLMAEPDGDANAVINSLCSSHLGMS